MSNHRSTELGNETGENPLPERRIESLDDITREIAERRLHAEFSDFISPEKAEVIREHPDQLEKPEEFQNSSRKVGLEDTTGVLGFSTNLESPAHVLKNEVPKEIATLIHEDLHRLTHPETIREMTADSALNRFYEGVTELLTERAVVGLHGHSSGECYPDEVCHAESVMNEIGEQKLRSYFFKHEMAEEVRKAIASCQAEDPA